jgi:hypothetical protein
MTLTPRIEVCWLYLHIQKLVAQLSASVSAKKSGKEGDTNTQQLKNIRLAKEIGFDLGAITFSRKINVLLMRILSGLSYDGLSGLNFLRLEL